MMVGNNLKDSQLQQIVDKTIMYSDQNGDGKISFDEFCQVHIFPCILCSSSFARLGPTGVYTDSHRRSPAGDCAHRSGGQDDGRVLDAPVTGSWSILWLGDAVQ